MGRLSKGDFKRGQCRLVYRFAKRCWAVVKGRKVRTRRKAHYEDVPPGRWPRWVVRALDNDTLRGAWEEKRLLILTGKRFVYRVTPAIETQGHWAIGRIERRRRNAHKA